MSSEHEQRNKRLGVWFLVFAGLQPVVFLLAAVASMTLPWLGMAGRNEREVEILMLTPLFGGWAFCVIAGVLFLPSLISGIGIVKRQKWGRILGVITAVLALVEFPLGTWFGIYALRRLRRNNAMNNLHIAPLAALGFLLLLFPSTQALMPATPNVTQSVNPSAITEITLRDSGGFCFDCTREIVLRSDGTATYSGGNNVRSGRKGDYQGSFDKRSFTKLARFLINRRFFSLKDRYAKDVTDSGTITTTIAYKGGSKTVANYAGGGGQKLSDIQQAIEALAGKVKWEKTK